MSGPCEPRNRVEGWLSSILNDTADPCTPRTRIELWLQALHIQQRQEAATAVHYTADTGKTDAEKAQARSNIGAQAETDNSLATTAKTVVGAINEVNTRVDNINAIGRFLAYWNCTTGLPLTNPAMIPYTYKTGDYFVVSTVGATNYKPSGTSYNGTASTTTESATVSAQDIFRYDGTNWALAKNTNPDLSGYVATFSQSFTDAQKTQARQNINAASIMVTVPDTTSTTATLAMEADRLYTFAQPLTALTVSSVADHCAIQFTAGASVAVSIPASVTYAVATPSFAQGSTYYLEFAVVGSSTVCVWSVL